MSKILEKISKNIPIEITKDKLRDAARLALQSSISAALCFTLMQSIGLPEKFLAILSAILVVEPSIGNTFDSAKGRILATIAGSAVGFIFVIMIPWGFGTAISLMIGLFMMTSIASFKPSWHYGLVAVVAISLASESNALDMVYDRLIAIGIGISVGLGVTAIVWPERSSKRANKHLREALYAVKNRFEIAYENSKTTEKKDAETVANDFYASLGDAKAAAKAIKLGDKQKMLEQVEAIGKLYNSVLIIHRVADNADSSMLDEDAGIENDAEKVKNLAIEIIDCMINKEDTSEEKLQEFSDLVARVKKDVNTNTDDTEQNMFRHAFVFGITEIEESLRILHERIN